MEKQEVLKNCTIDGNVIKLPDVKLERKVYQEVAKSIELIGGKWKSGKISGFLFDKDPSELFSKLTEHSDTNIKKKFQFFATPEKLADKLVELSSIDKNDTILEPSAGQGSLIKAINKIQPSITVDCYELLDINVEILNKSGLNFNLIGDDFLNHRNKKYSKIIANPPFTNNQDIQHLRLMYDYLSDGGRLVCITSESWITGNQKKQIEFREWLSSVDSMILDIEKGEFKESGTLVGGKIVIINK